MKVEELIEELKKQDPKAEVLLSTEYAPEYVFAAEVRRLKVRDNMVLISS